MHAPRSAPGPSSEAAFAALEAELTDLWGHINATTCRFLELLAEFDRAEAWARHGLASCAQWLNLHCGIGPLAAREKVRVARALERLPAIAEAFRNGQLSYSKVRAMTRVATPHNEATLLNVGLYGTAHHVERLVRSYRRVERRAENEQANRQHAERFLHIVDDVDGSIMLHARLPAEVGALVRRAIEAAMDSAFRAASEGEAEPVAGPAADETRSNVSAETPGAVEKGAAPASAGDAERSNAYEAAGARRADALQLLAEHYLACESARCPSSSDRYQVVVHIDQRLLSDARAQAGGVPREEVPAGTAAAAHDAPTCCELGTPARCEPIAYTRREPETPARCEIEDGPALAVETARRLACDSALVGLVEDADGEPLDVGRKTRAIPPAMKRALKARDGGCRFPGCDRTRFTEGHHVRHWADGGETRLSNLVTLCRFHHRLLHEGGFGLAVADDGAFVFRDSAGQRLTDGPKAAQCFSGNNLRQLNVSRGIAVRRPPGWHGERMDYGLAIEAMLRE